MASTLPAMKGTMGGTEFYLISLKARELVNLVKVPKDMPGWDNQTIEEIYQRTINETRVRNQIAPYLARNKDTRFFGALIVAAFNFDENVYFTPLRQIGAVTEGRLRPEEREAAEKIGILTLGGGVMMVPLDGQHRLRALDFAMHGKDHAGKDIPGIDVDPDLANEDISVILVPYEAQKARRIFTRVNRYARQPSASETYVTDDEDVYAVLARRVANQIGGRLVKYKTPTLTPRDKEFTTLAILHVCCKKIVEASFPPQIIAAAEELNEGAVNACEKKVLEVWKRLTTKIDVFADLTADMSESGDGRRTETRKRNLLGKPVSQECLVSAYLALVEDPTRMSWENACQALNAIPWEVTEKNMGEIWQYVLWTGGVEGRIITKNRLISSRLIAYMAGEILTEEQQKGLLSDFRKLFPEDVAAKKELPERVGVVEQK